MKYFLNPFQDFSNNVDNLIKRIMAIFKHAYYDQITCITKKDIFNHQDVFLNLIICNQNQLSLQK